MTSAGTPSSVVIYFFISPASQKGERKETHITLLMITDGALRCLKRATAAQRPSLRGVIFDPAPSASK
jgi:hypothetical protein